MHVVNTTASPSATKIKDRRSNIACYDPRSSRPAFTLIEIMVVVIIIVLLIGMAIPVFRVITGSRSEAGATNIIAGMLARARSDAIGLQKPIGVAFVYNNSTQKSYMAEVGFPDCPISSGIAAAAGSYVYQFKGSVACYYVLKTTSIAPGAIPVLTGQNNYRAWQWIGGPPLDMLTGTDLIALPSGIGTQTVCNCNYNGATRISDGYLALGVILFDGKGRLTSQPYGLAPSPYCQLLNGAGISATNPTYPVAGVGSINNGSAVVNQYGVMSQFGLVVYQKDAWLSQASSNADALYLDATPSAVGTALPDYTTGSPTQQTEENWLDQNATPLLINRYTGSLIKAE